MAYTVPYYHSTFPGEPYLQYTLPDYARERFYVVLRLLLAFFLFFVWLPRQFVFRSVITENYSNAINNGPKEEESGSVKNTTNGHSNGTAANGNSKKKKKRRDNKGNGGGAKSSCSNENEPKESSEQQTQGGGEPLAAVVEFDQTRSSILTLLGIIIIFFILFLSPNNTFPSRTLLRTPLFTREECDKLVKLANEAAKRNAEIAKKDKKDLLKKFPGLSAVEKAVSSGSKNETEVRDVEGWRDLRRLNSMLKAPAGWKKDRHTFYPTTDLNLVSDPFNTSDREWLASILDARLSPVMERAYGVFRGAIRTNDMFVVRYDGGEEGQDRLRKHTDSSHLSFNVLLNDEFEGGGTRYHNRITKEAIDVNPAVGEALLSHAMILHEGLPTTKGTRYILVGFNTIDEKDPITEESTNLSIFSSWFFNFSWMQIRFREGAEQGTVNRRARSRLGAENIEGSILSNKYVTSLFRDLDNALTSLGDKFSSIRSGKLIADEKADEYMSVMDRAFIERTEVEQKLGIERSRGNGYSSWFQGQNIHLDVFGGYSASWKERKANEDKFRSETL